MPERDNWSAELRGDGDGMNQYNYGFGKFFEWFMGGAMLLIVALLCWLGGGMVSVKTDVAVLKDRPQPVTKAEFDTRMESFERRLSAVEAKP